MVFKHYAFDQYPYGANILVKSTKSSISNKIGLERIDFITSSNEPVSMTYSYEEINGTLVSISTNLILTLDKKNHTFTLSNSNIFGDSTKKPYIQLLCNDVTVPISFFTVGDIGNKWRKLEETSDQIKLWDGYPKTPGKLCIPREITIGWSQSYTIQLFTDESSLSSGTGEFCRVDIDYGYLNNKNEFIEERNTIFMSNIHTTIINSENSKITIPPLNGTQSIIEGINHQGSGQMNINEKISITRKFYKYFRLGFLIRLDNGYGRWQGDTAFYVENTNKIYYPNRIDVTTTIGKYYLESDGFPILNTSFSNNWNTDFFYTIENNENMNISPSSSQIEVEYLFQQTEGDDDTGVCGDDYWGQKCGGTTDDGTCCGSTDDGTCCGTTDDGDCCGEEDDDDSCGGEDDDDDGCGGEDDDDDGCGEYDDGTCCGGDSTEKMVIKVKVTGSLTGIGYDEYTGEQVECEIPPDTYDIDPITEEAYSYSSEVVIYGTFNYTLYYEGMTLAGITDAASIDTGSCTPITGNVGTCN